MGTYRYKPNRQTPRLEAQVVGDEIERIAAKNGGVATPPAIVKESRPKEAVLHGEFEWRDKVAAEKYREHQARNVVNVLLLETEDGNGKLHHAPAYVNVTVGAVDDPQSRGYEGIAAVLSDEDKRRRMIDSCLRKLMRVRDEYRHLNEFVIVWEQLDKLAPTLAVES
jgi:hypothetical protein